MTPNPSGPAGPLRIEQRRSRGRRLSVLGVAVLLVTAGVAGCATDSPAQGDQARIKKVASQFATAVDRADVAGIVGLLCPEEAGGITDSDLPPDGKELGATARPVHLSDIRITGDVAGVRVTRPGLTTNLYLRREVDGWKVCASAGDVLSAGVSPAPR